MLFVCNRVTQWLIKATWVFHPIDSIPASIRPARGPRNRLANRPGMAGIVPELTHGVRVPGEAHFVPEIYEYMAVH